jgi:acetyl-CoA carboxylase biotin carboxylase subunit
MALSRVFIANRGEIAVRIVKACHAMGIDAIIGHSDADSDSMAVARADSAIRIGPPRPTDSYLDVEAVVAAAKESNCDALHPGYGFLAESPSLAEACTKAGIIFIGPDAATIRRMGNKLEARDAVSGWNIPVVPGSKIVRSATEATAIAETIGFPLMIKAAAGGGGRGIKVVTQDSELSPAIEAAAAEAMAAFGDNKLFIERYIPNARHIEVQILGDKDGNVVHLGERDCSIQRRYQKVVEEAPARTVSDKISGDIREAAVTIATQAGYCNAGTIEFIFDQDNDEFYFLEMNTRIQVEHPVTEMITGVDLVQEQLHIAAGEPLRMKQSDITFSGHAIECRITAEAPEENFRPCPGRISAWSPPDMEGVRIDSHCTTGTVITPFYDSLLAKLIVHGDSRFQAIARMQEALRRFNIDGIETSLPFLRRLASELDYLKGDINTRWLEDNLKHLTTLSVSSTQPSLR